MDDQRISNLELAKTAERLEDEGALDEALDCWKVVLAREPNPVYLCRFGMLAERVGMLREAEEAFRSAINAAPGVAETYDVMGGLLEDQGRHREAEAYLTKGLLIKESAAGLTILGCARMGIGDVEAARENFKAALRVDAMYEEAYYNLGLSYRDDQPDTAITLFIKALEIDNAYAMAERELGRALYKTGKSSEGKDHILRAADLNPLDGWAHLYAGNIMRSQGELGAAESAFKKAIEAWPNSDITYRSLALLYEYTNREDEARLLYEVAIRVGPEAPEVYKDYGLFLKDLGETERAKEYLMRAASLDPEDLVGTQRALATLEEAPTDSGCSRPTPERRDDRD